MFRLKIQYDTDDFREQFPKIGAFDSYALLKQILEASLLDL